MKYRLNYHLSFLFILSVLSLNAQEKENDTIKTDELIITKKYSPTVNDAFKIKPQPQRKDTLTSQRKSLDYSIINIPVASTFTPSKGVASNIERQPRPRVYKNYASLGAGSYANILAEFYGEVDINRNQKLDIDLNHFSSSGGVDRVFLDDDFLQTFLGLNLETKNRDFRWSTFLNTDYQSINWYGININALNPISQNEIDAIDSQQNYFYISTGGSIAPYQSFLDQLLIDLNYFADDFSNSEIYLKVKPELDFYLMNQLLETDFEVDYLTGSFSAVNAGQSHLDYNFLNLRMNPHLRLNQGNLSADLGAQVVYSSDIEAEKSDFYVYPKVNLNYAFNDEKFVAFTGARGNLEQNSYQSLVNENPFVQPFLNISPTNHQIDAYVGLKGKFVDELSFLVKGSYEISENYAFYASNPFIPEANRDQGFEYGNSFNVVYDDLKVLSFQASLQYDLSSDLQMGFRGAFNSFSTDILVEAINLPEITYSFDTQYQINDQWSVGGVLFYRGERKDFAETPNLDGSLSFVTIDDYLDVNLQSTYQINEKLAVFVQGNNLIEGNYRRWKDYRVQSLQILGGLQFQFDW
ncbi:MAG: TonB-dependent receptor [Psychroflexus sp.]|nr:TonB-dependent receptor [Psychroflexus sp.]MDR9449528.1 TonB-dependent receptor [Psychroflexus sp.]